MSAQGAIACVKRYRRIATRYEKLAVRFLAFIHVACIFIRLL
ncbi:MAG: transposase [Selenomonadaceae bacterium]|nr:transposase [Selenomonadaceae bacterium]